MIRIRPGRLVSAVLAFVLALPVLAAAQGAVADYRRADTLRDLYNDAAPGMAGPATWVGDTSRFWYRVSVTGGNEFLLFDVATREKRPAFDHEKLAAALSKATGEAYKPSELPFSTFTFTDKETAIDVRVGGTPGRAASPSTPARRTRRRAGSGGRRGPTTGSRASRRTASGRRSSRTTTWRSGPSAARRSRT